MSEAAINYKELVMWRDICEWMSAHGGYADADALIKQFGAEVTPLVSYDRTRRQALWDNYKIQLIIWEKEDRHYGCWALKGNWEFKIEFLEQVVLKGKNPDTLPKRWLDKWQAKQHKQALKQWHQDLNSKVAYLQTSLNDIETCLPSSEAFTQQLVNSVRRNAIAVRQHLKVYREKFDDRPQPEPGSAVLGGSDRQPRLTDAVLGGKT